MEALKNVAIAAALILSVITIVAYWYASIVVALLVVAFYSAKTIRFVKKVFA